MKSRTAALVQESNQVADPEISKGMRRSVTSDRSIAGPGNQAGWGEGGGEKSLEAAEVGKIKLYFSILVSTLNSFIIPTIFWGGGHGSILRSSGKWYCISLGEKYRLINKQI